LNIKHLTLYPECSFKKRVFESIDSGLYSLFEVAGFRVREAALAHLILREIFDSGVLILHHQAVEILVVLCASFVRSHRVDHGVADSSVRHLTLGQEVLENVNAFAVGSDLVRLIILNLWEIGPVLLKNLAGRLLWQAFHLLSDLASLACEDLKFF
jgi:hypothetical protein